MLAELAVTNISTPDCISACAAFTCDTRLSSMAELLLEKYITTAPCWRYPRSGSNSDVLMYAKAFVKLPEPPMYGDVDTSLLRYDDSNAALKSNSTTGCEATATADTLQ